MEYLLINSQTFFKNLIFVFEGGSINPIDAIVVSFGTNKSQGPHKLQMSKKVTNE